VRKELKEIAAKSQELAEEKAEAVQFLTDRTLECLRPQEKRTLYSNSGSACKHLPYFHKSLSANYIPYKN